MGGDFGASVAVEGARIALHRRPELSFILYGDEKTVAAELVRFPKLGGTLAG